MDSNQIYEIVRNSNILSSTFRGIHNVGTIQNVRPVNGFLIVNVVDNPNIMGHWVLIFFRNSTVYFFDSFGKLPVFYDVRLRNYINSFLSNKIVVYAKPIQANDSLVCGAYCLYNAYYMTLGRSVYNIKKKFKFTCKRLNDRLVVIFVLKIYAKHSFNTFYSKRRNYI